MKRIYLHRDRADRGDWGPWLKWREHNLPEYVMACFERSGVDLYEILTVSSTYPDNHGSEYRRLADRRKNEPDTREATYQSKTLKDIGWTEWEDDEPTLALAGFLDLTSGELEAIKVYPKPLSRDYVEKKWRVGPLKERRKSKD